MKSILIAAVIFAAACGRNEAPPKKAAVEAPKPAEIFHVDPATAGVIKGKVTFTGKAPAPILLTMDSDPVCQKVHEGHPVYDQAILTGKGGALANSFVYIQTGMEGRRFEMPQGSVLLDQTGCTFQPRVLGIRAGQFLDVKNSDNVSHNVHPKPKNNYDWNQQQSPGAPDLEHKFPRADIMIPVKCTVHSWMHAFIGVVDHPYFAVTGTDGAFELKNVPPGDYTLAVWQEKLGEQKQEVHLAPSGTAEVHFTYQ